METYGHLCCCSCTALRGYHSLWIRTITYPLLYQIPVVALDTLFYGELTVVPWNIVKYNVFPEGERGPDLYGTESAYYYLHNLLLNLNVVVPFALASLPALAITYRIEYRRLGDRAGPESSSHYTEMAVRLAPMYLWFAIMFVQPHKEERFLYPVYPLIYFNAAVTIYLARGWMEVAYVKITKSPYRVSLFLSSCMGLGPFTNFLSRRPSL